MLLFFLQILTEAVCFLLLVAKVLISLRDDDSDFNFSTIFFADHLSRSFNLRSENSL